MPPDKFTIALCLVLSTFACQTLGVSLKEDLTLNKSEILKLGEFRELVRSRLPHKYMEKDIYLIRWLRAQYFNIPAAEKMLLNNLKWREEQKMDEIINEDWSDFDQEFRYEIQGCDKDGHPVLSVAVGDWDIRRQVVAGKSQRMMRYFDKIFEQTVTSVRSSQERGENLTQTHLLFEMSNYNLVLQGCPLCIPVYLHFFRTFENHYPNSLHRATLVNVPWAFITLWEIIRPFLAKSTGDLVVLHGKNKEKWQSALRKEIDETQLTKEFGGLKDEGLTLEELLERGESYFRCSSYAYNFSKPTDNDIKYPNNMYSL